MVRERTTPKKQPQGVRRPIEVLVRVNFKIGVKSLLCQVLEDSGTITLTCSFTYDHDLHESLRLAWIFDSGSGPNKRIGPRESGRVTMRSVHEPTFSLNKKTNFAGLYRAGQFF